MIRKTEKIRGCQGHLEDIECHFLVNPINSQQSSTSSFRASFMRNQSAQLAKCPWIRFISELPRHLLYCVGDQVTNKTSLGLSANKNQWGNWIYSTSSGDMPHPVHLTHWLRRMASVGEILLSVINGLCVYPPSFSLGWAHHHPIQASERRGRKQNRQKAFALIIKCWP